MKTIEELEQLLDTAIKQGSRNATIMINQAQRIVKLRIALLSVIELCNHGDFKNGVTDQTGMIDEGEVRAGHIIDAVTKVFDDDMKENGYG